MHLGKAGNSCSPSLYDSFQSALRISQFLLDYFLVLLTFVILLCLLLKELCTSLKGCLLWQIIERYMHSNQSNITLISCEMVLLHSTTAASVHAVPCKMRQPSEAVWPCLSSSPKLECPCSNRHTGVLVLLHGKVLFRSRLPIKCTPHLLTATTPKSPNKNFV